MMLPSVLLALLFICCTHASKVSSTYPYRSQSKKSRTQSTVTASQQQPCTGEPSVPCSRRACKYYVWDLRSALLYKWCNHLLKDHIYEGRGGKRFVRFESNSILQLLYPCSRYAPDRCMVCGGGFSDHLELWWSKHLYTPWDLYMDRTYKEGEVLKEEDKSRRGRKQTAPLVVSPPKYAFHRRYVDDISHLIAGCTNLQEQKEILKDHLRRIKQAKREKQRLTRMPEYGVAYMTPYDFKGKEKGNKRSSFVVELARILCLLRLESLVLDQEYENKRLQNGY